MKRCPTDSEENSSKPQWGTTLSLSEWQSEKKKKAYKYQMWERAWRRNPPTLLVGMEVGAATVENSTDVPQTNENRVNTWFSNFTSGYLPEENENTTYKRHMHPSIHCNIIYNCQDTGASEVSQTDKWIKMWGVYNIKNGIVPRY